MNDTAFWYLISGLVLGSMAVLSKRIEPLPVSSSIIYLAVGILLGPWCLKKITLDLIQDSRLLETLSEVAVLISIFTAGLKLKLSQPPKRWIKAIILTFVTMVVTIAGITFVGTYLFAIPLAVAALLGAVLAPTDPVLASSIQVKDEKDHDLLRFNLTAEAALNDGAAFPFVLLFLGIITMSTTGFSWSTWVFRDLLWAVTGSVLVGGFFGIISARIAAALKKSGQNEVVEDLFCIGILFTAYACALYLHTYGFVACFFAGLFFRQMDSRIIRSAEARVKKTAPYVLQFSEQVERILEFLIVITVGILVAEVPFRKEHFFLAAFVVFIIRPAAIYSLAWFGIVKRTWRHAFLVSWLGVRGVGSIYYFMYAVNQGLSSEWHDVFCSVIAIVACSIVIHGITSGPLMKWHDQKEFQNA